MVKDFLRQYRNIVSYLFFGVCTTLINIISYYLCVRHIKMSTGAGTITAWGISVLFAYITNKLYVFESRSWNKKVVIAEITSFFSCRLLTGILDLTVMLIFVDWVHLYDVGVKLFSNVLVVILNYIASRFIIFKKRKSK